MTLAVTDAVDDMISPWAFLADAGGEPRYRLLTRSNRRGESLDGLGRYLLHYCPILFLDYLH